MDVDLQNTTVPTASLPPTGIQNSGRIVIQDAGSGNFNLVVYVGDKKYTFTGTANSSS